MERAFPGTPGRVVRCTSLGCEESMVVERGGGGGVGGGGGGMGVCVCVGGEIYIERDRLARVIVLSCN